ncbi:MAG: class I SAM-dependent methyltransferase [candidate division Zixibacteria bacterium]|nr:class I SAM-dependent methyltransferase [candidate division Zixibacteria bacterium]
MSESNKQKWSPDRYAANARFVSDLGMPVVELLAPKPGERILDLGCGDGALTVRFSELGCETVGVDASPDMIAVARARGLDARVVDGQALDFENEFDAVFSNAALHWMKKPERVVEGVWWALKAGGRFVGEFGGYGNVAAIVGAVEVALARRGAKAENPWFFPRPETYRILLENAGFVVRDMALFPRPTPLPGDIGGWLETFAGSYTSVLPDVERKDFIAGVVKDLRPVLSDTDGNWTAEYVRLRFAAIKPGQP